MKFLSHLIWDFQSLVYVPVCSSGFYQTKLGVKFKGLTLLVLWPQNTDSQCCMDHSGHLFFARTLLYGISDNWYTSSSLLQNSLPQDQWYKTTTTLFWHNFVGQEHRQGSADRFFCPTWHWLGSLSGTQLADVMLWRVQGGFTHSPASLMGIQEGWLSLLVVWEPLHEVSSGG